MFFAPEIKVMFVFTDKLEAESKSGELANYIESIKDRNHIFQVYEANKFMHCLRYFKLNE